MTSIINVYCDESCHLKNDKSNVMVLGSVWCAEENKAQIYKDIRKIKAKFGLKPDFEIKWTKVSPAKLDFYLEVIKYFFNSDKLRFRGILIPDKSILKPENYSHSYDDFYYIMYYHMLKHYLDNDNHYKIYIDIKDTRSWDKTSLLKDFLNNYISKKHYYTSGNVIEHIQLVRSHEVEILQITDLLIGAIGFSNRKLEKPSPAKTELVKNIILKSKNPLNKNSLWGERKFNLFVWEGDNA